ncbi:uncharacterized protein EI97DRAFT_444370 [Westerdykella ornata]|uniref:Uncharacterized protein n=1 Tax=Westerdykella ornata TaxID=318751 RepID=A0A6A6JCX6_WESOR|nr:uncharacterized protein EI97DRAFT_444370 [Westerdykella ornata]KAF2274084.1 hypothetical protein EI97DRAFT_444370 [Westerdykella ornata]
MAGNAPRSNAAPARNTDTLPYSVTAARNVTFQSLVKSLEKSIQAANRPRESNKLPRVEERFDAEQRHEELRPKYDRKLEEDEKAKMKRRTRHKSKKADQVGYQAPDTADNAEDENGSVDEELITEEEIKELFDIEKKKILWRQWDGSTAHQDRIHATVKLEDFLYWQNPDFRVKRIANLHEAEPPFGYRRQPAHEARRSVPVVIGMADYPPMEWRRQILDYFDKHEVGGYGLKTEDTKSKKKRKGADLSRKLSPSSIPPGELHLWNPRARRIRTGTGMYTDKLSPRALDTRIDFAALEKVRQEIENNRGETTSNPEMTHSERRLQEMQLLSSDKTVLRTRNLHNIEQGTARTATGLWISAAETSDDWLTSYDIDRRERHDEVGELPSSPLDKQATDLYGSSPDKTHRQTAATVGHPSTQRAQNQTVNGSASTGQNSKQTLTQGSQPNLMTAATPPNPNPEADDDDGDLFRQAYEAGTQAIRNKRAALQQEETEENPSPAKRPRIEEEQNGEKIVVPLTDKTPEVPQPPAE